MYNPYFGYYAMPAARSTGFLSNLFADISFGSIINGTSKALNVVNQTIPLIKQAGPIIKNAKTMFKVMNEFKKNDDASVIPSNIKPVDNSNEKVQIVEDHTNNSPTFFI